MAPRKQKKAETALPELVLECIEGPASGAVFDKQVPKRRIGRVVKGNQVHVKDGAVSQNHAEVLWDGKQWTITDLGSSNGTAVNGADLVEGEPVPLADGDLIVLGASSTLRVKVSAGAPMTLADFLELRKEALKQSLQEKLDAAIAELEEEGELAIKTIRAAAEAAKEAS